MDYQIAGKINDLRKWADKGYRFIAVINPDEWLVGKEEEVRTPQGPPHFGVKGYPPEDSVSIEGGMKVKELQKIVKEVKEEEVTKPENGYRTDKEDA